MAFPLSNSCDKEDEVYDLLCLRTPLGFILIRANRISAGKVEIKGFRELSGWLVALQVSLRLVGFEVGGCADS